MSTPWYCDSSFSTGTARLAMLSSTPKPVLFLMLDGAWSASDKELLESVGRGTSQLDARSTWPKLSDGGVEAISDWLGEHPDAGAVAIRCLDDLVTPTNDGLLQPSDLAAFVRLVEVVQESNTPLMWLRRWASKPTPEREQAQRNQTSEAIQEVSPDVVDRTENPDREVN